MSIKPDLPVFCLFKKGQTVRHKKSGDLYFITALPSTSVMKIGEDWKPAYMYSPCNLNFPLTCARDQHDFEAKFESVRDVAMDPRVGDVIAKLDMPHKKRIVQEVDDRLVIAEGTGHTFKAKDVYYRVVGESNIYKVPLSVWANMCKESSVDTLAE